MVTKRGQGLSVNAIILIILGVIVLVVLAVGFTTGWKTFTPWINTQNNVAQIAQSCQMACSTGAKYEYCTAPKELLIEKTVDVPTDEDEKDKDGNVVLDADGKPKKVVKHFENGKSYTCNELTIAPSLGVAKCPAITC